MVITSLGINKGQKKFQPKARIKKAVSSSNTAEETISKPEASSSALTISANEDVAQTTSAENNKVQSEETAQADQEKLAPVFRKTQTPLPTKKNSIAEASVQKNLTPVASLISNPTAKNIPKPAIEIKKSQPKAKKDKGKTISIPSSNVSLAAQLTPSESASQDDLERPFDILGHVARLKRTKSATKTGNSDRPTKLRKKKAKDDKPPKITKKRSYNKEKNKCLPHRDIVRAINEYSGDQPIDVSSLPMDVFCHSNINYGIPMERKDSPRVNKPKDVAVAPQVQHSIPQRSGASAIAAQVKLVNGKLELDHESQYISHQLLDDDPNRGAPMVVIEEGAEGRYTTCMTYARKTSGARWSLEETEQFYKELVKWGSDFEILAKNLPGRERRNIRLKFKREEKLNPHRISEALVYRRYIPTITPESDP